MWVGGGSVWVPPSKARARATDAFPLNAQEGPIIENSDPACTGQTIPVSFRSTTLARGMDDRWHAEFHLRGPMKCVYEAVQTAGSVKTKSGFRQKLR